jgi:PAS domain S-box-containing protein
MGTDHERGLTDFLLRRLNRLHTVLSKVGEAIVRIRARQELYEAVCRIVVEDGKLSMVLIGEVDEEARVARLVASHGAGLEHLLKTADVIPLDEGPLSQGTIGTALRTGVHDFCNDVATAARMKPWRESALRSGLLANASFPLKINGATVAVLVLYADEVNYFLDDEIRLMDSVANNLSFALEAIEKEAHRRRAEDTLRQSEHRMAAAQRIAHFGGWEINLADDGSLDGNTLRWSDEMFRIAGYEPGGLALSHEAFLGCVPAEEHEMIRQAIADAIEAKGQYSVVHRLIRPGGEERFIQQTGQIYLNEKTGKPNKVMGAAHDITERKQAEREMHRQATEMQVLFDLMPASLWFKDTQNRVLRVNQRAADGLGKSAREIEGKFTRDIYGEGESASYDAAAQEVIRSGAPMLGVIKTWSNFQGEERWVQKDIVPVKDAAGRVNGIVVMAQDVTERKRAEEELKWKTAFLEAQVHSSLDGIIVRDHQGRKLLQNQRMLDMFHIPGEIANTLDDQRQARWITDLMKDPERFTSHIAYLREHPDKTSRDEFCLKEGTVLDRYSAPVLGKDGTHYGRIWTYRDVTEQKRMEARFRRLIDSDAQAVFFWNKNGEITGSNEAFLKLAGYTRADLEAGQINWIALTPAEYSEHDERALRELESTGICKSFEKEFMRKDGSRVPVLMGAAMFEDNPDEGVCFVLDLTERKKMEKQFLRAQRMESIGTLAGGIAHDLNNALTPIMMVIAMLGERWKDDTSRELLALMEGSARHGAELVGQVLSFARGVDGQRILVNPVHILREIQKIVRDTFPKNIQAVFNASDTLGTVTGDPTQLHQVITNLCVNARDAMPDGGLLEVTMEMVLLDEVYAGMNPDSKPGSYVAISVRDTGSGIAPDVRDRIFEPFFTTKEFGKGTGLGLSTTMAIVKSHGGFINLYSEMGKGTTFNAYLPANLAPLTLSQAPALKNPLPRGNGELVLVVDDEAGIRAIAQETLERFGFRALVASNGAEAVALYAEHQKEIALVLTDMAMPVMDGAATIVALRTINPEVVIIGSSGLASFESVSKAAGAPVRHFIAKPYTAQALLKVIAEALGQPAAG